MNESKTPLVFLGIGWMHRYQGIAKGDVIRGGGAFVKEHGYGHEIFNFRDHAGMCYGYVQPVGRGTSYTDRKIRIERLGAASRDEAIEGVLALWTAPHPQGGTVLVGWYNNATVYRRWQPSPSDVSDRRHGGKDFGYYVSAAARDCVLLPTDERTLELPVRGVGGMGQSRVWYADKPLHGDLRNAALAFVRTRRRRRSITAGREARQPNILLRIEVESAAIDAVSKHYSHLGYQLRSFEKDNVGWDLEATLGKRKLLLEVKGLSSTQLRVGVTPNEYRQMVARKSSYRLCVVTDALHDPTVSVFEYVTEVDEWQDADGRRLTIEEVTAATCYVG